MGDLASMFAERVGPGMTTLPQAITDSRWAPTPASPAQERQVQLAWMFDPSIRVWKNGIEREFGGVPSLDDSSYDTRGAILAGLRPQAYAGDGGRHHWGSIGVTPDLRARQFKSPDSPTRWMESYDETFGSDPLYDAGKGMSPEQSAFFTQALSRALGR